MQGQLSLRDEVRVAKPTHPYFQRHGQIVGTPEVWASKEPGWADTWVVYFPHNKCKIGVHEVDLCKVS